MRPQIAAIGPDTKLVTLTAGGNDIGYIGDLLLLSYRQRKTIGAIILSHLWKGARPAQDRNFQGLQRNIIALLDEIRRRAPQARIVVVTYPTVLPPDGTCAQLGIGDRDAAIMRGVAGQLAQVTRDAAQASGAIIVDMASLSNDHNACSTAPWVNGAMPAQGAAFHPTLAGATATAQHILLALNQKP